ncbi:hypothetical protein MHAE_12208 [Mycobacterium haemophilum DSM 44634]|uniref:hypothetical protein n=1 Tax=Mycobacterium haemophilum TaxID=29311 RepID=UPI0006551715|nr:hypothetical protein [Mycobacterium haemophilum]AKN15609.1 hypothetical protein B586_01995 [Mycobacterium haemophilum DSM 44634]MCV7342512.1 hypothetical protein [Mycobacterium haemophilum DSM 44634]
MSPGRRPRRFGYAVGATLIATGGIVAISLVAVFLFQVTSKVPTRDHAFGNNQATTVHVNAGGSKSIYTNFASHANIRCTVRGDHAQRIFPAGEDFGFIPTSLWRARLFFKVKDSGNYTIRCSGPPDVYYGVGDYVGVDQFIGLYWGIGAGVALAAVGVATLIISTVRRA